MASPSRFAASLHLGVLSLLSAFLLFQVQPVIAKIILPWFGGSSAVWSACMVFFQSVLLAGYLYAHWLHEKLSPKKQALVHTDARPRHAVPPLCPLQPRLHAGPGEHIS